MLRPTVIQAEVAYAYQILIFTTDGFTVLWPNGQDICPDELYDLGKLVS